MRFPRNIDTRPEKVDANNSLIHTFTQKSVFILILPPKSAYFCLKWHISLQKFAYLKNFVYLCTQFVCKVKRNR